MINFSNILRCRNGRRSMTIVEVIIASTIVTITLGFIYQAVILIAREYRVGLIQAEINARADMIQDNIFSKLRHVSSSNIVQFSPSDIVPGQTANNVTTTWYHRIIFRLSDEEPFQELRYDPTTKKLIYNPDRNTSNNEVDLTQGNIEMEFGELDYVWFGNALQPGNLPDSALILVELSVSDHGKARQSYRNVSNESTWIKSNKSFCVYIRND